MARPLLTRRDCLRGPLALAIAGAATGGFTGGCAPPFQIYELKAVSGERASTLVVFVTGYSDHYEDVINHQVIDVITEHAGPVDTLVVQGETPQFISGEFDDGLNRRIVQTPRFERYARRVLIGFSGGGTAALGYITGHPDAFADAVLYAPYLGPGYIVEEIDEAGGLARWQPSGPQERQEALWVWLRRYAAGEVHEPALYLLWSREDEVAVGLAQLEQTDLRDRIIVGSGEHGWPAFDQIWPDFVRKHAAIFRA